jgi:uncharacterized membrane protein
MNTLSAVATRVAPVETVNAALADARAEVLASLDRQAHEVRGYRICDAGTEECVGVAKSVRVYDHCELSGNRAMVMVEGTAQIEHVVIDLRVAHDDD